MSYDLIVFDPRAAPKEREAFMKWYDEQVEWGEQHSHDDPAVCAPSLRAWFMDMIVEFPAMNGPHAAEDVDDPRMTDYCVGASLVCAAFSWSQAEPAYRAAFSVARKHGLGFLDISSSSSDVWGPTADGTYEILHSETIRGGPTSQCIERGLAPPLITPTARLTRMNNPKHRLESQDGTCIEAPNLDDVERLIRNLHPKENAYVILSDSDGSYVQVAGARLRLTVEFRERSKLGFIHWVLGSGDISDDLDSINCSVGPIEILKHERLCLDDAIRAFGSFLERGTVPASFTRRDDSARFNAQ